MNDKDKEYIILNEIHKNSNITQRELSKKAKLSLGSINILLNRMAHDGLIKLKQIPMSRVLYSLTPKGMADKTRKTRDYIKMHYKYINDTKMKLTDILTQYSNENTYFLIEKDEIYSLIRQILMKMTSIKTISNVKDIQKNNLLLVTSIEMYEDLSSKGYNVINIMDLI